MQSLSIARPKEKLNEALEKALAIEPTALFVFAAPSVFRDAETRALLTEKLSGKTAVGCSTAGEIACGGMSEDSVSLLAIRFDNVRARTAGVQLIRRELSFTAGKEIGELLREPNLKALFLFGPGTNVNGTGLIEGVESSIGGRTLISGGLAADGMGFRETFTLTGGSVYTDHVVALALYGDDLVVSNGSEGGWRPFGPARKVTKIDQTDLLELDGKPALRLYKQYLGEKARELPASGLSYPFGILRPDRTMSNIIRSAVAIDVEREALILAGELREGTQVCLMHTDTDALTQGAAQAAAEALRTHAGGEEGGCALVVSCIGRKYVYGFDVDEEIETIVDSFLPQTPVAGFYSYGEVFTNLSTGRPEFRNQTITITYITERKAHA